MGKPRTSLTMWKEDKYMMAALILIMISVAAVYQAWAFLSPFSPHQTTYLGVSGCILSVFDPW